MHGGPSTGPRTAEGLERSRKSRWWHGGCSAEAVAKRRERGEARRQLASLRALLRDVMRRGDFTEDEVHALLA